MKNNITALKKITAENAHTYHLISSRFSFLLPETKRILKAYGLTHLFHSISFNETNKQPHIFKHEMLRKKKITAHIDDELLLLEYLAKKNPTIRFLAE